MLAKKKLDSTDKQMILKMARSHSIPKIAEELKLDARSVSGFISMARRRGVSVPPPPPPLNFPSKDDQIKTLAKAWRESKPEAEFSMHTEKGQTAYIACYKGGLVLRVGEQKKVALLTSAMGIRFGQKLLEMAQWSNQIR
jgi:hypothetical protein